jgi:large subunit ribosomal protein L4
MRRKAMFMVLSDKVKNNSLAILEKFDLAEFKTRVFSDILKNLEAGVFKTKKEKKEKEEKNEKKEKKAKKDDRRSILFVNAKRDEKIKYSGRNLAGIEIINLDNINILDLLKYRNVVFTDEAIEKLEEIYKKQ